MLWALQCAFVALLLLLLWQPALSVAALRPQQNIVAVVVDDSLSMATKDEGASRRDEAARLLDGGLLTKLAKRFQVRLYKLGADTTRIERTRDLHASEPATHLGSGLDQLASEAGALPIGAVVLLSDGADNSGGVTLETLSALRARHLPVSTIGFGKERLDNDVELDHVEMPALNPRQFENTGAGLHSGERLRREKSEALDQRRSNGTRLARRCAEGRSAE